jgi:hypothetical protein
VTCPLKVIVVRENWFTGFDGSGEVISVILVLVNLVFVFVDSRQLCTTRVSLPFTFKDVEAAT